MQNDPDSRDMRGFNITRLLPKIYADDEITVLIAPDDKSLENLILEIVKSSGSNGINMKELRRRFSGISSEDKIRKAVYKLVRENKVYVDSENGTLYPIEL
jgi:hypothetical protein